MMYHCKLCGKNIDDDTDGIYNHLKQHYGISTQRIVRLDKYMYPLDAELPSTRDFKHAGYSDEFWETAIGTGKTIGVKYRLSQQCQRCNSASYVGNLVRTHKGLFFICINCLTFLKKKH